MNVNVHIERLVLDGLDVDARDGDVIADAVRRELAKLIGAAPPPLSQGYSAARVRAAPWTLSGAPNGAAVGRRVAQSIYREIGGGGRDEAAPRGER